MTSVSTGAGSARRALRYALEIIGVLLLAVLALVVVVAVAARYLGMGFAWYDEVASILLAWLTYFGAALAALRGAHLGFDNLVMAFPRPVRRVLVIVAELVTIGFFAALSWGGWRLLDALAGETLVSLPWVPVSATQAVIPIAGILFIVAELAALPDALRRADAGAGHLDEPSQL